tara:strand:- start:245 stop:517 length:273 start_codon:yes stop_codon:yes gene_type:complete
MRSKSELPTPIFASSSVSLPLVLAPMLLFCRDESNTVTDTFFVLLRRDVLHRVVVVVVRKESPPRRRDDDDDDDDDDTLETARESDEEYC